MKRHLTGILGLLALSAGIGFAGLGGTNSLVSLSQNAGLIVVGGVTQATRGGAGVSFTLQVSRVVKGDATLAGNVVPVSWNLRTADLSSLFTGGAPTITGEGLWFLKASSNGWALLPWLPGGMPIFQDTFIPEPVGPILSAYNYQASDSLLDKIASEVSNAIESTNGAKSFQLVPLHQGLLEELRSPVIEVLYQRLSVSPSAVQRELGVSGLVRNGNSAAIVAAAQLASGSSGVGALVMSVRNDFRATDPTSVVALGKAAGDTTDPNISFREAAAHALAAIHTATAVPWLAALLDDGDAIIRAEGISGLSSFANGLPLQNASNSASMVYLQTTGDAPFRTADTMANRAMGGETISQNEGKYLPFWKNWWVQNRALIGN